MYSEIRSASRLVPTPAGIRRPTRARRPRPLAWWVALAAVALTACGHRGDPTPPPRAIPVAISDLAVVQRGDRLVFSMTYPNRTVAGLPLDGLTSLELRRAALEVPRAADVPSFGPRELEGLTQPILTLDETALTAAVAGDRIFLELPLAPEELQPLLAEAPATAEAASESEEGWISAEALEGETVPGSEAAPDAALPPSDESTASSEPGDFPQATPLQVLLFTVRTTSTAGEVSTLSNVAEMVALTPPPAPTDLRAEPGPEGVRLTWSSDYVFPDLEAITTLRPASPPAPAATTAPGGEAESARERNEEFGGEETTDALAGRPDPAEALGEGATSTTASAAADAGAATEEPATEAAETVGGEAAAEESEKAATALAPIPAPDRRGFRVYRRPVSVAWYREPIAVLPQTAREFVDETAAYGQDYVYGVATAFTEAPSVESALTGEVEVAYRDIFAPPAPGGLVALPEEGRVRLLWDATSAADVAGYVVYRQGPRDEAPTRLTSEPVPRLQYLDETAEAGRTYRYAVAAVDRAGNLGDPAEAVEVTAR